MSNSYSEPPEMPQAAHILPDQPDREPVGDHTLDEQIAEIADAVAELQAARVAQVVAAETARRQLRPFEMVMVALLAVSLIVHALTIGRLLSVRGTLRGEVERLAESVQAAKGSQVRYDLPIDQQVPIDIDVPIQRSLDVPINTSVRINQTLSLPVDTALGSFDIPVPIDTTIPISTTVPIAFDQTVNISTTVPLHLNVPVQVDLGSQQIAGYLDRLHQALLDLRDRL
ncbi:MAG: hypothetical protein IPO81_22485 [Kouleothrix sp.]|nr:hypothetical protein [Kouleothrix sp.]